MSASPANKDTRPSGAPGSVNSHTSGASSNVYPVPSPDEYRQTMRREAHFWIAGAFCAAVVIGFWGTVIAYAVKYWPW